MTYVRRFLVLLFLSTLFSPVLFADRVSERYSLVGSIAVGRKASLGSVAMIRDRSERKTLVVKVGQKLSNGDIVMAIEENRVILGGVSRLVVERETWGGASDSSNSGESSTETPYFGAVPEAEVSYDSTLQNQEIDFPVEPGSIPLPPAPPMAPLSYSDPQSVNSLPTSKSPYSGNTSGYSAERSIPEYDDWQAPTPNP